jgi:hypothetical protein
MSKQWLNYYLFWIKFVWVLYNWHLGIPSKLLGVFVKLSERWLQ